MGTGTGLLHELFHRRVNIHAGENQMTTKEQDQYTDDWLVDGKS